MHGWKLAGWAAALVTAGVLGAALPGSAQRNKQKVESVVGFVDLAQITEHIKQTPEWKQMVRQFEDEKTKYRSELEDLNKLRYLTATEREELKALRAKPRTSDAEKSRIAELERKSDHYEAEFRTLSGVEKPTDAQKNRIQELAKMREDGVNSLQGETEKRAGALQKMEGELLEKMQARILKAVQTVAENKGLAMVVDRQAILYGGQDLTEDVIKRLK